MPTWLFVIGLKRAKTQAQSNYWMAKGPTDKSMIHKDSIFFVDVLPYQNMDYLILVVKLKYGVNHGDKHKELLAKKYTVYVSKVDGSLEQFLIRTENDYRLDTKRRRNCVKTALSALIRYSRILI